MADEDEDALKLHIDGTQYSIDADDLELWEVEILEDACNQPLEYIDFSRAAAVRALVFIVKHREDESFSMADARRLKVSRLGAPEPDPTPTPEPEKPAAKKRPTKAATSG
jgi:hypothetical protein